jgi:hypothetical protein
MKNNFMCVIETNEEIYHHEGRGLLYVYPDGNLVHISRVKENFGIKTLDLINQCSTRDYIESNFLLIPKNMRIANFEWKIDHDKKTIKSITTLSSNAGYLLDKVKEVFIDSTYKDYSSESEFIVKDDNFECSQEDIDSILKDFDYDNYISSELNKEIIFPENINDLFSLNFVPEKKEEIETKEIKEEEIPF